MKKLIRNSIKVLAIMCFCVITASNLKAQNRIEMFIQSDSLTSLNKLQEAEHLLVQLSQKNPYNSEYFYFLGQIYNQQGEYEKSITELKKAQALGKFGRSNYFLSCNYLNLGQRDSAVYYLSEHLNTPLNGDHPYNDDVLTDSIFQELSTMEEFRRLLPPVSTDSSSMIENWITDLTYLSTMLKKTHYNPFIKLSEVDWDHTIDQLITDIPQLNDDQIWVRIAQFVKMIGDGHTRMLSSNYNKTKSKDLPWVTRLFSDGCYIIKTSKEYTDLLGAKILRVEDMEFDDVYKSVCSVIAVDNDMDYRFLFDWEFYKMNILHGLGICSSIDELEIEYSINGEIRSRKVFSETKENFPDLISYQDYYNTDNPIFLENYRKENLKWYWFKYLPKDQIIYVQINAITSLEDNPLPEFCDRIKALVDTADVSAFVFDIRNNGGGNTELNKHFLSLMLSENVNIKGKSFTVIGPHTFSAAQNLTNILENYSETIFIGEPSGSKPNFIGEVNPIKLPYTGIIVSSSNLYHQYGYSSDKRIWVAPDVYIDFRFENYKEGIDPVLSQIKAYLKSK